MRVDPATPQHKRGAITQIAPNTQYPISNIQYPLSNPYGLQAGTWSLLLSPVSLTTSEPSEAIT
jgi:hypothetical protein